MKGLTPMISFVLTILFVVLAVAIALTAIKPTLQKSKAFAVYSEGTQNLQLLDSAIREVASEAQGSKRTIYLTVTDGTYEIDQNKNLLYFKYKPPINLGLSGHTNNAWIEQGLVTGDWFNSYPENDNASENWRIISGNWKVASGMYSGTNGTAYLAVNEELDGFSFAADIDDESGKGEAWVEPVNPKDLVGYWTFDEGTGGVAYDWSGHNNTGVLKDANSTNGDGDTPPQWIEGKFGKALKFDGVDDYVEVPYSSSINPPEFTVSVWAKVEGGEGKWRSVVTSRDGSPPRGYIIYAGNNDKWQFWIGDGSTWRSIIGPSITLNTWYHLVAWYKDGEMRFYVNGKLYGPASYTLVQNTRRPLRVGAGATEGNPNYFFNGTIDEVRIYNRALSEAEIKALYEDGLKKLNSTTRKTRVATRLSPYIVLSNPFGTSYFDNIRIDSAKDDTIYVIIPYNNIDLKGNVRISKGNYQVIIENVGTDQNGKPIVRLSTK